MQMPADKVNILLVDDQPSRLLSYEAVLAQLGENLVKAHSGEDALRRLMEAEYAVILLDVSMPGMDGFETAELIHQHPRFENTPIIFVTGVHVGDLDRLQGYRLGAIDYVQVPLVPDILRSKVAVLVELYRKRRALAGENASLVKVNLALQTERAEEYEALSRTLALANAELSLSNAQLEAEVTERRRAETQLQQLAEKLRQADRRKDEFLATLAHELRNPLAPIYSAVELMQKETASPAARHALDVMDRQLRQLVRLVDDLLDVSRITHGRIELRRELTALEPLLTTAVETTRPHLDALQHRLSLELDAGPVLVDGDAQRLTQVFGNLLNNAAKYTLPGGRIVLGTQLRGDDIVISVRDSGIGIPPSRLEEVFDLFVQVDTSLERSQGGLGIGLTLVRRLVQMHGGSVVAHSEGEGHGSCFEVILPVSRSRPQDARDAGATDRSAGAEASSGQAIPDSATASAVATEAARAPASAAAGAAAPATGSRRILIVDDNRDAANTLAMLLDLSGHVVHTVYDPEIALTEFSGFAPDIMFLDVGMPKLNGLELAMRIRALPGGDTAVLIALTGWGQAEDRRRTREAGIDYHLVKPADPDEIERICREAVRGRTS
ncbi:response regulator [Tahibacter harae]|uniref:histidine kinase n=1 Tax=Tahibacter harae TaxID=2963937 RepID=A0ABT1QRZ7_9GAMM|nr:response regulator [Tahibacter harae]MCQ4165041.1 response regulator [Tahibacter harae]